MKNVAITGFLFIFLTTLNVYECSKNKTNVTSTEKKLRPVEEFERKLKQFWSWIQGVMGKEDTFIGRCFGGLKKLRLVINFIIFKLGVIVTALVFLSVLMFKSLGIGVLLLVITSAGLFSKLALLKHGGQHASSGQAVHLHIHNKGEHHSDIPFEYSHSPWHDRLDSDRPKDALEKQAIADLYKRIGLSENAISAYS